MYLDDIISFGSTFDDALANLTLIFERLRSYGLQLKSSKCHLFRASVPFLGHIVGRHGLECDPTKIEDVKSWPIPDCLKSLRQFLGFVGYHRRFIPRFADVATPLVSLTGKDVPFVWDSSCSTAFGELRAALIDAPILAFPTETGLYVLDTDASNFGLGSVLSQIQNDQERVVAYCSRALRPSQRRYCTTKREMLAAVAMCIQFRSYLRGARFTLRTDHKCNKTQETQQHILENCPGFRTTTANTPYNMYFNDKENATDEIKEILQKVMTQINNMTQEETNQEST